MWPWMLTLGVAVAMVGALILVPFGLPGIWLMALMALVPVFLGALGWTAWGAIVVIAGVAEVVELVLVKRLGERAGGSSKAFWGAVAGGFLGLFVGLPVPVIGPMVTAFVGTFLGAGLVTLYETRSISAAGRVGWGVVLARTGAVAVKVAGGLVILAITVFGMAVFGVGAW